MGSHLCEALLARGEQVVCVDNYLTGSPRNVEHLLGGPDFELIEADITEPFSVAGPVDHVLNFASPASPIDYAQLPIETLRVGSLGTEHGLQLARDKEARFLQASTSEVYGDPLIHPQVETYFGNVNPLGPRSCYDEAKRYGEALCAAYARVRGVEVRIVRIFNTYGPRMRLDDGRVVPAFISQLLRGEDFTVFGRGEQTRSFCYVSDEVRGILLLLDSNETGPVNIGNPAEMTVLEFVEAVRSAGKSLGLPGAAGKLDFKPFPENDPKRRRPDITKARKILGWEPKVSLEEGLKTTIAWFKDHGFAKPLGKRASLKVLVTGGAGFIGSNVCDAFKAAGHEPVALDNLATGKRENLSSGIRLIEADIRAPDLATIFEREKPDAVSHHAAQIDVRKSVADPIYDAEINLLGMLRVLEASVQAGVRRFLFASSGGACYGEQETFPATETHPCRPVSPYGTSKAAGELYLGYYRAEKALSFAALRYANVYGPRQDPHGEAGVVAIFAQRLLRGQPCTIFGDGANTRDFVYVGDVARANLLALTSAHDGPINIGTGRETSVNQLYRKLANVTGVALEPTYAAPKPGEQRRSVIDPGLASRVLGWKPRAASGGGADSNHHLVPGARVPVIDRLPPFPSGR